MAIADRVLVALPLVAIAGLVAFGWWSTGVLGREAADLARTRVGPLVEVEFPAVMAETGAQRNLLEADRSVHRALIAEKLAIAAEEEDLPALAKDNAAGIAQARTHIGIALGQIEGGGGAEGTALLADLAAWEQATQSVIVKAGDAEQHKFAVRASEGSAADLFAALRKRLEAMVEARGAAVTVVNDRVKATGSTAVHDAGLVVADAQRKGRLIATFGVLALALAGWALWLSARHAGKASALAASRLAASARGRAELAEVFNIVTVKAQALSAAAGELRQIGTRLDEASSSNASEAGSAATAAEAVSRNVQSVASSAEEMSASIREISGQAVGASKVGDEASKAAADAKAVVARLGEAGARIGEVVKSISGIAAQTNLLALNATIEAARAGEAGRGFAVVASEVKALAQQTQQATQDVQSRASQIGSDVQAAVEAMARIDGIIVQIVQSLAAIAAAVEEQSATTTEISRSVGEAAKGAGEIAQAVSGLAERSRIGTADAAEVARQAGSAAVLAGELSAAVRR